VYNQINQEVTCDGNNCSNSLDVDGMDRNTIIPQAEEAGWKYNGLGEFRCPKCIKKEKK
jgi:hypothetical protein